MNTYIVNKSNHQVPSYSTEYSAGMDLRANLDESVKLKPMQRAVIPTGIFIELPEGYEAQVRARSGLSINHGIGLVNGVGTIDSDYRGEIKVPLINWGAAPYKIEKGDRIAQMIIARYERISWESVEELGETMRNEKGFGSSGK